MFGRNIQEVWSKRKSRELGFTFAEHSYLFTKNLNVVSFLLVYFLMIIIAFLMIGFAFGKALIGFQNTQK